MHLRMTGNLLLSHDDERPHLRARFLVEGGKRLLFSDVRRFGTGVVLLGSAARDEYFDARLGPEPLDPEFTADALRAMARGRRAPVKAFLLNQERIAGVGNIYADEALFRAKIHPCARSGTCAARRWRRSATPWWTRSRRESRPRAPRSTTSATRTAPRAPSRTSSWPMAARASPARAAAARSARRA